MNIQIKNIDCKSKRIMGIGFVLFLFVVMELGCAGTHRTTTTQTTMKSQNKGILYSNEQQAPTVKDETTTTTTKTKDSQPGVLRSVFSAIGHVISIPFIIIGGVFRTIFGG